LSVLRKLSAIVLCLGQFSFLSGCGLFSTREPEEPAGGSNVEWEFPRSPEIVVDNLETAVGRRSSVDYMKTFDLGDVSSADFVFIPDPGAAANNPGRFDAWNLERERNYAQSLFSPTNLPLDSLAELFLEMSREPAVMGDSADLSAEYELNIGHTHAGAPRRMRGYLDFSLKRAENGGWYVWRWQDKQITGSFCWSDLKAQF
jgi:hypothetical protein